MPKEILERDVKKYLYKRVKEYGGEIRKVKWEGRRSAPDQRVMIPPAHRIPNFWAELKAPGKDPTDAQMREHNRMFANGESVWIIDSYHRVDVLLPPLT